MGLQWKSLRCHALTRLARALEAVTDQYLGPNSGNVQPLCVDGEERAAGAKGSVQRDEGFARLHVTSPHLRYGCALTGALAAIMLVACGGSTDAGGPAPAIAYSGPAVFTLRVFSSYKPDSASFSTITVRPVLPAGLWLDSRTGTIEGAPTAVSPGQEYTVSASNAQGIATTKVALEVNDGLLFYPSPAILALGVAMSPLIPNATTYLSAYSVDPALPNGLSLDPKTGVISGTPTEPSSPSYYKVISTDHTFKREYGLTLGVTDPAAPTELPSAAPFSCVHSGGFIGTFAGDSSDKSYGLIAIAFTPDGRAKARVFPMFNGDIYGVDGRFEDVSDVQALSLTMDGTFEIDFGNGHSLRGSFSGPDLISGTYQVVGETVKAFSAARLGGSAKAQYRYTGGFYDDQSTGQTIGFATVDITGSAVTGTEYQESWGGTDYLLINAQLPFDATIANGMFTVSLLDSSTYTTPYTAGQSGLFIGDYLFALRMMGCQLN
jgi:Putative Ig domain